MQVVRAKLKDENVVLNLLDEFRADCGEQVTGKFTESNTARENGRLIYKSLLEREDYAIFLLVNSDKQVVGIITGYLCPMLRNGGVRAEVEEFFVQIGQRGNGSARLLMNAFFDWCKSKKAQKVNLESENELKRAHSFYKKYGFDSKAQRFVYKLK